QAQAVAAKWNNFHSNGAYPPVATVNNSGWIIGVWNRLCAETIMHPTVLSEYFLDQANDKAQGHEKELIVGWRNVWAGHQASREAFRRLIQVNPRNFNRASG